MSVPYIKIKDRVKYVIGYCPKCLYGKTEMFGLVMKCRNCGYTYDPDERAFMKLRHKPEQVLKKKH